jgi:membrane associated rhomboid family serine protease
LVKRATPVGFVYGCTHCHGRAVALPVLRRAGATDDFMRQVVSGLPSERTPPSLRCPYCNGLMGCITIRAGGHELEVDFCRPCAFVWFDADEIRQVPTVPQPKSKPLSAAAREQMALLQLQAMKEAQEESLEGMTEGPPEWWQWLPGVLGLPVEYEAPPLRTRPVLTISLAAALVLVYAVTAPQLGTVIENWGFIPALWSRHGGLTLFTAFFLHSGILHLLSNVYFLLIFGDNVEDNLGWLGFLLLLAGADVTGNVMHACFDPRGMIPCVGASGGLCGIIGYYAVMFPMARLGLMWRWFAPFAWIRIPAIGALAVFVLIQFLGALMQYAGYGQVSCLAHLGGLAVGIAVALVVRLSRPMADSTAIA